MTALNQIKILSVAHFYTNCYVCYVKFKCNMSGCLLNGGYYNLQMNGSTAQPQKDKKKLTRIVTDIDKLH